MDMTRNQTSLTVGVAAAAVIAGAVSLLPNAANAADWNYGAGSVKDYGQAGVPVPAPVPIPDYAAKWYLRADIGFGWLNAPSVGENGMTFGTADSPGATGPTPFGTQSSWFQRDFQTSASYGVGAGYYWTPGVRTDITGEVRSQQKVNGSGSYSYQAYGYNAGPPVTYSALVDGTGTPNVTVNGNLVDTTTVKQGVFLFNAYYDMPIGRGFTPYVGAGIGVAVNELDRTASLTESTCDPTSLPSCAVSTPRLSTSVHDKTQNATLAWALMVGTSYDLTRDTKLDVNYRYMHIDGTHMDMVVNGSSSRISIGDVSEHAIRAGIRWNIE